MAIGSLLAASAVAASISFALCWLLIRFGDRLGLVQAPNHRSSHHRATPSAGGIGIVAGSLVFLAVPGVKPTTLAVGFATALVVAGLGFLDDRFSLSARHRLAIETVLVLVFLFLIDLPGSMAAPAGWPATYAAMAIISVMSIWWINLFNFMDGIDGLAATQALFVCATIFILAGEQLAAHPEFQALLAILAAALLGFLALNRPPARLFMGDVGSLFLAFVLLTLAVYAYQARLLDLAQIAMLPALFVADTSLTLVVRLWRRDNVFEAHRSHAYQVLARHWHGHLPVVLVYGVVNVLVVLPCAWAVGMWPDLGPVAVGALYFVLLATAWSIGAGRR